MEEPKVFISYSWSNQSHQELVKSWADRLIADGIDVVLDIYDGQFKTEVQRCYTGTEKNTS